MDLFTEYPEQNEQTYEDLIAQATQRRMENLFRDADRALRDTHAKTQVCVQGTLEIFDFNEADIRQALSQGTALTKAQLDTLSLKQGLLAQPRQYPVWLRFANGRTSVESDYVADTRSMSVKVMGVEGDRLPQSHEAHTQDLITQNAEVFFIRTIQDYHGFFNAVAKSKLRALLWLLTHPKQFSALKSITSRTPKSLLTERYWSGSAFALGLSPNFKPTEPGRVPVTYPVVVKYAFTPVSSQSPHAPIPYETRSKADRDRAKTLHKKEGQPDNYYRHELIQALAQPDAEYCWDFQIQIQTQLTHSIDDVTTVWPETEAPFFTVGRLSVKHQTIHFDQQCDFCENLRFAPWNGLAVHRPVGALNRLRRLIYPIVAEYRHQKQGLQYQEPTGQEQFDSVSAP